MKDPKRQLVAAAAVLGVVAGACAGYLVQAGREPTLPLLVQPALPQARGPQPEPLTAEQDRKVRNDGDLRELLLETPDGATTPDWVAPQGWMALGEYADMSDEPETYYDHLEKQEFLRAAVTGWDTGSHQVEIWLAQFEQREAPTAPADDSSSSRYWAETDPDVKSRPIPGTGAGRAYLHPEPSAESTALPGVSAEAHASRGDLSLHIWVYGEDPVPWGTIMDLAERQMVRL
ncbi:hypothetical protein [Streptomyces griseorubiginosus]|uniref:hypothetical protein n=1 Tax=Streptomyces griseorubiginosus TaxID=67304 RepID=UPI002E8088AD|nr:hypothetical protein [Streptomyces griseorubiginosus]WUB46054.1 hypothetical protein OHN19_23050 [Streptomyces griseorubiginosus]WUB54575.1 hypothetical protein OG942_23050 [Streptomyces griseorubiginosus]